MGCFKSFVALLSLLAFFLWRQVASEDGISSSRLRRRTDVRQDALFATIAKYSFCAQLDSIGSAFHVIDIANGKAMSVDPSQPVVAGAPVLLKDIDYTSTQDNWIFEPSSGGAYHIVNEASGLAVILNDETNGRPVVLSDMDDGETDQEDTITEWCLLFTDVAGCYQIIAQDSKKRLDVSENIAEARLRRPWEDDNNIINQRFKLVPVLNNFQLDALSATPSVSPTADQSANPTHDEPLTSAPSSALPSETPSLMQSAVPTITKSAFPSIYPTHAPSGSPTSYPSKNPSNVPSVYPTYALSALPTTTPTLTASAFPSIDPTHAPSTSAPTMDPTSVPSTSAPTMDPTSVPSAAPSMVPNNPKRLNFLFAGQSNMEGVIESPIDELKSIIDILVNDASNEQQVFDALMESYNRYESRPVTPVAVYEFIATEMIQQRRKCLVHDFFFDPLPNAFCSFFQPDNDDDGNNKDTIVHADNVTVSPESQCGLFFGPELMFSHAMQRLMGEQQQFATIKYASGGSTLANDWSPTTSQGKFWPEIVDLIRQVVNDSDLNEWSAFVWFQGEGEVFVENNDYDTVLQLLNEFVGRIRSEISAAQTFKFPNPTDVPIVIVQVGCWTQGLPGYTLSGADVARAQAEFVESTVNAIIVPTDDLSCNFHYDISSQLIIGNRIAMAIQSLLGLQEPTTTGNDCEQL